MGSTVIDATATFDRIRGKRCKDQLTAAKHKKLMDTHRHTLVTDMALAYMMEMQRSVLGDGLVDQFLDEMQAYREYGAVSPHSLDDREIIENIVTGLSVTKDKFPVEEAFNELTIRAQAARIPHDVGDKAYKDLMSQAKNTSNGIALFREWVQYEDSQSTVQLASVFGGFGQATATTELLAQNFVDAHIKPSRSLISLNTQTAIANHARRTREARLEARGMASNLRLVKG